MSRTVHHDDAWPMCVASSASTQCIDDPHIVEVSEACAAHSDSSLTERDYIGLSAAATSTSHTKFHLHSYVKRECFDARDEAQEIGDTELRLGIGPHHGDVNALHTPQYSVHVAQSMSHKPLHVLNQILKQSEDESTSAQSRGREDAVASHSMEFHQSFWPWAPGVAPGRLMVPVPKVSTVPAKRPYMEAIGESQALLTISNTEIMASMQAKSKHISSVCALPSPALPPSLQGGGLYAWTFNTNTPPLLTGVARQHASLDQNVIVGGSTFAQNTCADRSVPSPPLFKLSSVLPVTQYNPAPSMTLTSKLAAQPSSNDEEALLTSSTQIKEDTRIAKAPVVGWPPVRSFRKNTLQSTAALGANKESGTSSDLQRNEDAIKASESAGEQSKSSIKDTLFVKAKLDGVRICRKVDLTSYSNYDSLKSALQEMFQGFVSNDNATLDLLHGKNYVLTHEDKDGDWMLVGDVPWCMFMTTVKSFRIMKAADAVGLGEKGFAKLKAQDMK